MTYEVEITQACKKRYLTLDRELQERFAKRIVRLAENPRAQGKPLRRELHGYWEVYFEKSFRILYVIKDDVNIVLVKAILHKDEF